MFHRVHHSFEDLIILDRPIDLLIVHFLAHTLYYTCLTVIYSDVEKGCRKKCTRQSPKVLWVVWSALFFKEIWKNVTGYLRCYVCDYWRKATKVGSTTAVARNSVLIISHITFRDCRVHIFSDNLSRNNCIRNSKWDYMYELYFKDLDYIRPQKFYHLLYSLCMVSSKHLYWFSLVLVSFISFSISFLFFIDTHHHALHVQCTK